MFAFAFSITFRFPFSPLPHNRDDWAVVHLWRDLWRERKGTFGFARYKETCMVCVEVKDFRCSVGCARLAGRAE